jgi:hypothetical protein
MRKRSLVAGLVLLTAVLGRPAGARAGETTQIGEALFALAAFGANVVYVPVKAALATGGLVLGSAVGLGTGGDMRSAYALWVPAASGTFVLRAANIEGSEPIEFFGSDYADEPSPRARLEGGEGGELYESLYR